MPLYWQVAQFSVPADNGIVGTKTKHKPEDHQDPGDLLARVFWLAIEASNVQTAHSSSRPSVGNKAIRKNSHDDSESTRHLCQCILFSLLSRILNSVFVDFVAICKQFGRCWSLLLLPHTAF